MCIRKDPFPLSFCVPFPFFSQTVRLKRAFAHKGKPCKRLLEIHGVDVQLPLLFSALFDDVVQSEDLVHASSPGDLVTS